MASRGSPIAARCARPTTPCWPGARAAIAASMGRGRSWRDISPSTSRAAPMTCMGAGRFMLAPMADVALDARTAAPAAPPRPDFEIVPLRGLPIVGAVLVALVVAIAADRLWALEF